MDQTVKRKTVGLEEVAERIGISYETARRWASAGVLPTFKYHDRGRWFVYEDDLDRFMAERQNGPAAG